MPTVVPDRAQSPRGAAVPEPTAPEPELVPALLVQRGRVCVPGADGPVVARGSDGRSIDPLDAIDGIRETYSRVYFVDLDAIEGAGPQLDYLQEIARDIEVWADAGVSSADQAIDILVAGAQRVVLSTALLEGPRPLRRLLRLTTDVAVEIEVTEVASARLARAWGSTDYVEVATEVRAVGIRELIVSPRAVDPDWALIARVAAGGPTWVDGSFDRQETGELRRAKATGGIFHFSEGELAAMSQPSEPTPTDEQGAR